MYKSILATFMALILALTLPLSAIAAPDRSTKKLEKGKQQPVSAHKKPEGDRVKVIVTVPAKGKSLGAESKNKEGKKVTKIKKKEAKAEKMLGRFASSEESKTAKGIPGPQRALQVLREKLSKLPEVALKGIYRAISVITKWFSLSFATDTEE
jgi:hypothetical protein